MRTQTSLWCCFCGGDNAATTGISQLPGDWDEILVMPWFGVKDYPFDELDVPHEFIEPWLHNFTHLGVCPDCQQDGGGEKQVPY